MAAGDEMTPPPVRRQSDGAARDGRQDGAGGSWREVIMHYYMLANGEYSNYGVNAIVCSETEITPAEWEGHAQRIQSMLNQDATMRGEHFLSRDQWRKVLIAAGFTLIEYVEYDMDAREDYIEAPDLDKPWRVWAEPRDYK